METQDVVKGDKLQSTEVGVIVEECEEDFDFEEDEYTAEERLEMEAFYEESIKNFKEGKIVEGQIIRIDKDTVLIDVGFKSEGMVPRWEFSHNGKDLEIGDKVEVYLERTENNDGIIVLSKEKANRIKVWEQITKAFDQENTISGTIVSRTKGGLTVDIGLKAFLPGSQIDVRPIKNLDSLIGEKMELRIIKMDKKRSNIVLSRRIILEKEREKNKAKLLETIEVGKILEGVVKNITDYGAFIDLGGIDGLLHIIDMSWGRINHPSELFAVGDQINVMVLKYEENGKVSLGYKQITENPWEKIDERYIVASRVKGKIVNIADYGAFIELEEGVEGLVHISDMSWNKYLKHPSKIVAIGDTVEAEVLNVEKERKRISLGMKQVEQNPWTTVDEKYPVGGQVEGTVRNITNFGVFVELEEGVDGLIHISDMSWTQKIKHPSELLKKRDSVKTVILNVDRENERISLGIKQLEDDPWLALAQEYEVGQTLTCTIVKITTFGAFAELPNNIEGLIHISQLSSERVSDPAKVVSLGDEVTVKIVKINAEERKLGLSIKAFNENIDVSELEDEISNFDNTSNSTTVEASGAAEVQTEEEPSSDEQDEEQEQEGSD